jgi:hypothetical protein
LRLVQFDQVFGLAAGAVEGLIGMLVSTTKSYARSEAYDTSADPNPPPS